jgi:hypothetical protein
VEVQVFCVRTRRDQYGVTVCRGINAGLNGGLLCGNTGW